MGPLQRIDWPDSAGGGISPSLWPLSGIGTLRQALSHPRQPGVLPRARDPAEWSATGPAAEADGGQCRRIALTGATTPSGRGRPHPHRRQNWAGQTALRSGPDHGQTATQQRGQHCHHLHRDEP